MSWKMYKIHMHGVPVSFFGDSCHEVKKKTNNTNNLPYIFIYDRLQIFLQLCALANMIQNKTTNKESENNGVFVRLVNGTARKNHFTVSGNAIQ